MKRAVLLVVLSLFAPPVQAGGGFLSGQSDLPLMPGLEEDAGAAVIFDSPEGRIAHFTARGTLAAGEVKKFYQETLPELGWTFVSDNRYRRENENLRLIVRKIAKGGTEIRFEISK